MFSGRSIVVNYFHKKGSIIDVWQGPKLASVDNYKHKQLIFMHKLPFVNITSTSVFE